LVDEGVVAPGSTEARYEQLSGGPGERTLRYVARRHLNLSWDEWRDLPWWVRRNYVEGLEEEELINVVPDDELTA
jgi:hypothetical protein